MNDIDSKQLFDIIFMMVLSLVIVTSAFYGAYKGLQMVLLRYLKSRAIKKIQKHASSHIFVSIKTFDRHGIPTFIEIQAGKNKTEIIAL